METEWYNGGLEDLLDDNGVNNNQSKPRKWSDGSSSRPSLGSLDETLAMDQTPTSGSLGKLAVVEDKRGRRKSWHIKMERKRRKGVMGSLTPPDKGYQREKRPSWWNIFVPDHWPNRSRRASQDVSRTNENTPPWPRSKSRSVDHGFSPPFDLDSLRNKVEGRFESVDKLGRDGEGKDGAPMAEKKVSRIMPPINTITYTVEANDTLTSVAARFDTTPSELTKLNRMSCKLVFPGQVLYVPDKRRDDEDQHRSSSEERDVDATITDERDLLDSLRPNSPHHMDHSATTPTPTPSDAQVHKPSEQRFLKINVRHITDGQGVVGGVLLVTPNAVMFDPNVSDPLVIERGPEAYGVIAPMEYVVNVAIYHDIAHMRVGHSDHHRPDIPKPEIYHARPPKDALLVRDEAFPELARNRSSEEEDNESLCSYAPREGDAFPKAFERDLVTPTNLVADGSDKDSRQVSFESTSSSRQKSVEEREDAKNLDSFHSAEERRRSCLDHHWAVPSRDRSLDKDNENETQTVGDLVNLEDDKAAPEKAEKAGSGDEDHVDAPLVKHSCHDSGIDIRDSVDPNLPAIVMPLPKPIAIPTKRVYSDAEIILASKGDFVPPITSTLVGFNASSSVDSSSSLEITPGHRKKTSSVSFSVDSNPEADNSGSGGEDTLHKDDQDKQESRKNKMLKRLSYPLAWMEGLTSDKDEKDVVASLPNQPVDQQAHASMFSKVFSRRSSVGTYMREPRTQIPKPAAPKLDYRSMVSVDDMPELFVSFDKLIPRPARSCEDPPLYLRLRMGKPIDRKIPKSTPIMSYGKKKMRPEYWFSVPRNRVDDLYNLLQLWVPQLYGDLELVDPASRGFQLVESDTELWEDEPGDAKSADHSPEGELGELTRESWEVLSMSEELRRALYATSAGSIDLEPFLPDLLGVTEILTEEHRKKLCRNLPARAEGYMWTLVFSTSQHGFSLNSMYRKMMKMESPILMVVEDTEGNVFGALTSCALKVSDHFYGTGESLLFRFSPEFQVFNWTGDNMYFIKGNNESLAIGAGDGKFGLWLDGDLYQGRTQPCNTYGNETLAPQEDFVVKTLECWAFV